MNNYDWQPKLPLYVWAVLALAVLWLIVACFLAGEQKQQESMLYDQAIAAHLEAMKHPMTWSKPEEYTIYDLIRQE